MHHGEATTIPHGRTVLSPGDKIVLMGTREGMTALQGQLSPETAKRRSRLVSVIDNDECNLVSFRFVILMTALCVIAIVLLGADLITGITATMATLGIVGPGLGQVGPMANYGHLHPLSKLVLTGAMWIGRLEILTVLALLRPEVWRSAHWRPADGGRSWFRWIRGGWFVEVSVSYAERP